MAVINFAHREVHAKLVYFGATGAGCNTNVRELHAHIDPADRSELIEFGPPDSPDHSRYFEFRAEGCRPLPAFSTRFRVYSLPGGVQHTAHRREILDGVDAVVFVSDARPDRAQANVESLLELERMLTDSGREISTIPTVIQVNHTDADDHRTTERVVFDLNPYGFPVTEASAIRGEGIAETHQAVVATVADTLHRALTGEKTGLRMLARHQTTRDAPTEVIERHIERIEGLTGGGHAAPAREADFRALPPGPVVDLPFLTDSFIGNRPAQVLAVRVVDDGVQLDLVMTRLSGAEPRRLTLRLASRPIGVDSLPSVTKAEKVEPKDTATSATAVLPDHVPLHRPHTDATPVWYGIVGLAGGLLIGLLIGLLLFL